MLVNHTHTPALAEDDGLRAPIAAENKVDHGPG